MHKRFNLSLSDEEKQALRKLANERGVTLGDVIRDACRLLLDFEQQNIPAHLFRRPRDKKAQGGEGGE